MTGIYLILVILLILLLDYLLTGHRRKKISNIGGLTYIPMIGSFFSFLKCKTPEELRVYNIELLNLCKKTYQTWIGPWLIIVTGDLRDIEVILSSSKHIKKSYFYDILHSWLGEGLLMSSGKKWFDRRKIITPAFHFKILEKFVTIFDEQSSILIEKLSQVTENKGFDIHPYISLLTLDIMAETSMGVKLKAQSDTINKYVHAIGEITNIISDRKLLQKSNEIDSTIHSNKNDLDIGIKEKIALLDVLLTSKINERPLSDSDIQEEVDTFLFEGHDTTTAGICYTLYLISRHPIIQQKLFNEIYEVSGKNKNTPLTYQDLSKLKYLECVIKETLRLYPPVQFFARTMVEDATINGKYYPKNTCVAIDISYMMRDPDVFKNPDDFIPERYLIDNNNAGSAESFAFVPFSAGPRNCIGQKFAMLELKTVISKILRNYELLPLGPEVKPVILVVLSSRNGYNIGIKKRIY